MFAVTIEFWETGIKGAEEFRKKNSICLERKKHFCQ